MIQENGVFRCLLHSTHELIAMVTPCIRPAKAQARPNTSIQRGVGHRVSRSVKELLEFDSYWEESQLSISRHFEGDYVQVEGRISKSV